MTENDMGEVFLVTSGEYSDFRIEGVFSAPEKAEEFQKELGKPCTNGRGWTYRKDEIEVVAWPIDGRCSDKHHTVYRVSMMLGDGAIGADGCEFNVFGPGPHHTKVTFGSERSPEHWVTVESSKGREHAIKLAVEARQKYMREKGLTEEGLKAADRRG